MVSIVRQYMVKTEFVFQNIVELMKTFLLRLICEYVAVIFPQKLLNPVGGQTITQLLSGLLCVQMC